jgi:antitoxin (DNA-binding transcriptional repressor) of toxin-antitoxin stability system
MWNNMAMRKVSVSDLHDHTGALVDEASAGSVIVIEKQGTPVAELHASKRVAPRDAARKLKALWNSLRRCRRIAANSWRKNAEETVLRLRIHCQVLFERARFRRCA